MHDHFEVEKKCLNEYVFTLLGFQFPEIEQFADLFQRYLSEIIDERGTMLAKVIRDNQPPEPEFFDINVKVRLCVAIIVLVKEFEVFEVIAGLGAEVVC